MSDIWFFSDHHFNHANILKFVGDDGQRIRPQFPIDYDADGKPVVRQHQLWYMNEYMADKWNEKIKPQDKVYHLGDFWVGSYGEYFQKFIARLNGKKRLVLGNHDQIKGTELIKHFQKVQVWRIFKEERFVCSHFPMRPEQFRHKVLLNVHGHLHQNVIDDDHYLNVCVERTGFSPLHIEEVTQIARRLEK